MKNTKKFFVVVTSLMLVFAMIGCDQGTKVEYRDRVVGGSSNPGSSNTPSQQFYINLLDPNVNPVYVTSAVVLNSEVTTTKHIVVGASTGYSNALNLSVGGEGPLFAEVAGSGTLDLKAKLTLAKGARLTVATGAAVNLKQPAGSARQELLTVKNGAIVDVKAPATTSTQGGLNIEPLTNARFEGGAILAVANAPSVVVVEAENNDYGLLTIESGLKLVVPNATTTTNVFTPPGGSTPKPIVEIQTGANAAIDSEGLTVYTTSGAETVDEVVSEVAAGSASPSNDVTGSVKEEAEAITEPLTRPQSDTKTYIIESVTSSLAVLKEVTKGTGGAKDTIGSAVSYTVSGDIKTILEAVYTPNAPDTSDSFVPLEAGQGKSTVAYTAEVSAAVLKLFYITIAKDAKDDLIEVKGTLPKAILDATSATDILVIDIGLPEGNTGLPTFRIPTKALGDGSTPYGGVRLRVNKGAYMHIEADNSAYIGAPGGTASGAGNPSGAGNFNNGCVEVMDGGKLRDGAYEGFPLGANATILNRLGSYLAVGPEPTHADAKGSASAGYNDYYAGWLIGPQSDLTGTEATRIQWDNQNDGYIQVGDGQLVLGAKVTVTKLQGLIYDVWFVNTDGAIEAGLTIGSNGALVQNNTIYKLYGQANHEIVLKDNGFIMAAFLESGTGGTVPGGTYAGTATAVNGGSLVITNNGAGSGTNTVTPTPATKFDSVSGYLNWAPAQGGAAALVGQLPVGKLASLN